MAEQVAFESPAGRTFAMVEEFPLAGGAPVKCLVIQAEDGGVGQRMKFDSPEADRLRERFPALKDLGAKAEDAAQPAATPAAAAHAEKLGVDLSKVEGSGAGGTITKADVTAAGEAT